MNLPFDAKELHNWIKTMPKEYVYYIYVQFKYCRLYECKGVIALNLSLPEYRRYIKPKPLARTFRDILVNGKNAGKDNEHESEKLLRYNIICNRMHLTCNYANNIVYNITDDVLITC